MTSVSDRVLWAALERVTSEASATDYFLEESKSREVEYSRRAFHRWMDTLATAQRHLGDTSAKSVLDVGVSPFTLTLPEFFKKVYALDLTEALSTRCARR